MLLLELLADVLRRLLLPRKEFFGAHSHAITRQGKSPTKGVPAEQNLVYGHPPHQDLVHTRRGGPQDW